MLCVSRQLCAIRSPDECVRFPHCVMDVRGSRNSGSIKARFNSLWSDACLAQLFGQKICEVLNEISPTTHNPGLIRDRLKKLFQAKVWYRFAQKFGFCHCRVLPAYLESRSDRGMSKMTVLSPCAESLNMPRVPPRSR